MQTRRITSSSNPLIKDAVRIRDGHAKPESLDFFIEGPHLFEAMLSAKHCSLRKVFFTEAFARRSSGSELLKRVQSVWSGGGFFQVADLVMAKLSDTDTPQGIAAIVTCRQPRLDEVLLSEMPMLVVSDGMQDPGNIGALVRLADAVGSEAVVVLPGSANPFMPKAVRSSAGSIFHVPVVFAETSDFISYSAQHSLTIVAADVHAEQDCFSADLCRPVAIVFGNEAKGIGEDLKPHMAAAVRIPIYGQAESLNVATAAAVLLYETVRQRGEKNRGH
ncbi:MAG: RNA methyltransferase TrmH family [Nitrospirae bacterium]|nr:MAG: RNA methyltransferase TrmH family [Nitrospirota bacterium]